MEEPIDLHGYPANVSDGNTGWHGGRQSDERVVSTKSANNPVTETGAESMENRHSSKKNTSQRALHRTPSRNAAGMSGLDRVREAARKDGSTKLTAL